MGDPGIRSASPHVLKVTGPANKRGIAAGGCFLVWRFRCNALCRIVSWPAIKEGTATLCFIMGADPWGFR